MGRSELSLDDMRDMLIHVSRRMEDSKDQLSEADRAIGDGDHGIGMARGFAAVRQRLEGGFFATIEDVLKATGMALMMSVGGAAGAIFGTLYLGGARQMKGCQVFGSRELALMLSGGLQAVQERGKAQVGDKTMVDALAPAAERAQEKAESPLDESLPLVAEAARQGMEATKRMVATLGKAKTLGERSLGFADPGAMSTYLMLRFMAEYVTNEAETEKS